MSVSGLGERFALDVQGLQRLKQTAREDSPAALVETSKQFEALFLQMMLKSMRAATPRSDLLDSSENQLYTELLDQQLAQHLAGHGLGLAEQLVGQLQAAQATAGATDGDSGENLLAGIPRATPKPLYGSVPLPVSANAGNAAGASAAAQYARVARETQQGSVTTSDRPAHVADFLDRLHAPARQASRASGVPTELILAQAALETGWGRRQITTASGADSHNLFGIKAGSQWRGPTTEVATTEYVDGQPQKQVEKFRVYASHAAALADYARLIGSNPRYAGVVAAADAPQAARALQNAGYASDPAYADKLIAVMESIGQLPQETPTGLGNRTLALGEHD